MVIPARFILPLLISIAIILLSFPVTGEEIIISIDAGAYEIIQDTQGFHRITMSEPGYGILSSPGDPSLPERLIEIRVPDDIRWQTVQYSVKIQKSHELSGNYLISPNPPFFIAGNRIDLVNNPAVYWGNNKNIVGGKNVYVYSNDTNYPRQSVEILPYTERKEPLDDSVGAYGEMRFQNAKYLRLNYRPFLYNPASQRLTAIDRVDIQVTYDRAQMHQAIPTFIPPTIPQQFDYVIITTNDIVANSPSLTDFFLMKSQYHNVTVVTETDYDGLVGQAPNGRAEKIRQWLIDHYQEMGINYVLLIGDPGPESASDIFPNRIEGDIPMKAMAAEYNMRLATDYFYADLTGNWDLNNDGYFGTIYDVNAPLSPDQSIHNDNWGAKWEGKLQCDSDRNYRFILDHDDSATLKIDGIIILRYLALQWPPRSEDTTIHLAPGMHTLQVEYEDYSGPSVVRLYWDNSPNGAMELIPSDHLFTNDNQPGLTATYYNNIDFPIDKITRKVENINFLWMTGDIGPGGPDTGAEVFIGRIPVYNHDYAQLDAILQKIILYESDSGDISWRQSILLPAITMQDQWPVWKTPEYICNDFAKARGFRCFRIYDENYGGSGGPTPENWPCTPDNVLNEWKKGYGIVTWFTHGSATEANGVMNSTLVLQLNDMKPSFTFQESCFNGAPDIPNNLGYALLKNGAIATVSGTDITNFVEDFKEFPDLSSDYLAYYYTMKLTGLHPPCPAGVALYTSKDDFSYSGFDQTNKLGFNLYGDPNCYLLNQNPPSPPLPSITITKPSSGEKWTRGYEHMINWSLELEGSYLIISLWKDGIFKENIALISIGSNDTGSFSWFIPSDELVGNDYRIHITARDNNNVLVAKAESGNFSIIPGPTSITVVKPNGGEMWGKGMKYAICWTYSENPTPYVEIDLLKNGILDQVINSSTSIGSAGKGSYDWLIPTSQPVGMDYTIKVITYKYSKLNDSSDGSFSIVAPFPVPRITTISPTSATAGNPGFTLTVNGVNFTSTSRVRWNGIEKTTTYISGTRLNATISAGDIATPGTRQVTVFNPAPGGGSSNAITFTVNAPPPPKITAYIPISGKRGSSAFKFVITGSGFQNGATISLTKFKGPTIEATSVSVDVTKKVITCMLKIPSSAPTGTRNVVVKNPDGGTAMVSGFTVN